MNVRRLLLVLALMVSGISLAGQATPQQFPSVDEVVARHLEAMGGRDRLLAIKTIRKVAKMTMQGREVATTMYFKRPNYSLQEQMVDGKKVVNGFDGTTPWIINPLAGISRPMAISGPQAASIREDTAFDGPLVDYTARGTLIDYVALEPLGEGRAHHLRVTSASRQVRHLYLDAVTYLEVKVAADVETGRGGGRAQLEQFSYDYRDVDGVKVAHHLKTMVNGSLQGEMHLESVQFNLPLDDAMFKMPKG